MSPDEVISEICSKFSISLSRPTLLRYERLGVLSDPKRGGTGGQGRFTDYPPEVVSQAAATWKMIHGDYGGSAERRIFAGKMPCLPPEFVASLLIKGRRIPKNPQRDALIEVFRKYYTDLREQLLRQ